MTTATLIKNDIHGCYSLKMPAPELKRGYRVGSFCKTSFNEYFDIPDNAVDLKVHFSKRPTKDGQSYKAEYERTTEESYKDFWTGRPIYRTVERGTLDGFEVPTGMLSGGWSMFKRIAQSDTPYVKVSYRTE